MTVSAGPGSPAHDPTARQFAVVERVFALLARRHFDGVRQLLHEDVKIDLPFQLPGHPRGARGGDAAVAFLKSTRLFDGFALHVTWHAGLARDSGVLVRYRSEGTVRSTGRPYTNSYLGVFEFDGALVSRWIEFHNPLVFCQAFGLDPLVEHASH